MAEYIMIDIVISIIVAWIIIIYYKKFKIFCKNKLISFILLLILLCIEASAISIFGNYNNIVSSVTKGIVRPLCIGLFICIAIKYNIKN